MRLALALCAAFVLVLSASPSAHADVRLRNFINWGCESVNTPARGCALTSDVLGPVAPGWLAEGSKRGEACAYNVLWLFSWGDVRIATAMRNGNMTQISTVDSKSFQLIPFFYGFGRYCTVVTGE